MDTEFKEGIIQIQSRPTVCHRCQKLLVHTYYEVDAFQPEIWFHVLCNDCYNDLMNINKSIK